jgi:hypothetical protein
MLLIPGHSTGKLGKLQYLGDSIIRDYSVFTGCLCAGGLFRELLSYEVIARSVDPHIRLPSDAFSRATMNYHTRCRVDICSTGITYALSLCTGQSIHHVHSNVSSSLHLTSFYRSFYILPLSIYSHIHTFLLSRLSQTSDGSLPKRWYVSVLDHSPSAVPVSVVIDACKHHAEKRRTRLC